MLVKVAEWLDDVLEQPISEEIVGFCFNLYEDGNNRWSMELVGTASFDEDDSDWACDEVTDFGTRENSFAWEKDAQWNEVLDEVLGTIKEYLEKGIYAEKLKSGVGVGAGFVDGDLEILYMK